MAALELQGLYVVYLDSRSSRLNSSSLFRCATGTLGVEAAPMAIRWQRGAGGRWQVVGGRWQAANDRYYNDRMIERLEKTGV
jgi:hypothetical protein